MSQVGLTVNGFDCTSVRMLLPWVGLWLADIEVALTPSQLEAFTISGPGVINIGGVNYPGTIDPMNSASFADRLFLRIVGGKGGWNQITSPKQYYSQNGDLKSTDIYADTAKAVGEPAPLDPTPVPLGTDYERMGASAAQVFGDLDWYVDPTSGVVNVAQWPTATPDASFTLDQFHPVSNAIVGTCDVLLLPGTVFTDTRLNGATAIARTVEQFFTHEGSKVSIQCSANPVERLSEAFTIACRQAVNTAYLKVYQYRFVLAPNSTSDVALQAITPGAPDLNPLHQWQSLSGAANKYAPSTVVLVGFTADSPPVPYLVSASPLATPIEIDLTAQTLVNIDVKQQGNISIGQTATAVAVGATGSSVSLAGGATALATAPWAQALQIALATLAANLQTNPAGETAAAAAGVALATALGLLPPTATTETTAT